MTERFFDEPLLAMFVLVIAALLGFLMGYFLRKPKEIPCQECPGLKKEISDLKMKILALESEARNSILFVFDAARAKNVLGFKVLEDDLKIVEGIGPKISEIFNKRGITTWKSLSESDPVMLKKFLIEDGGELYRIHVPDTWPQQARLAYEGKWEELRGLQEHLVGGKQS